MCEAGTEFFLAHTANLCSLSVTVRSQKVKRPRFDFRIYGHECESDKNGFDMHTNAYKLK